MADSKVPKQTMPNDGYGPRTVARSWGPIPKILRKPSDECPADMYERAYHAAVKDLPAATDGSPKLRMDADGLLLPWDRAFDELSP